MNDHQSGQAPAPPIDKPNENWIVRSIRQIEHNFQDRKRRKKNETPQDRAARNTATATWWIAGFTFVAVGVGISQAIIANRTLVAISGQLTEMQSSSEQVERSIKASNRIADESKIANALTGEANRPWIGAVAVTVVPSIFEGKEAVTTITLSNSGKSPAYVTKITCGTSVQPTSPTDPPYVVTAIQAQTGSKNVVVPGQQFGCPFRSRAIPFSELARIKLSAGQYSFYVYGEILYRDVATQSEHTTRVCWVYNASVDSYVFCPTYNSAK